MDNLQRAKLGARDELSKMYVQVTESNDVGMNRYAWAELEEYLELLDEIVTSTYLQADNEAIKRELEWVNMILGYKHIDDVKALIEEKLQSLKQTKD